MIDSFNESDYIKYLMKNNNFLLALIITDSYIDLGKIRCCAKYLQFNDKSKYNKLKKYYYEKKFNDLNRMVCDKFIKISENQFNDFNISSDFNMKNIK